MKKILILVFLISTIVYPQSLLHLLFGDDWVPTMDDGLQLWLQDPYATDVWNDSSANNNDITLYNAPTIGVDSLNGHNTLIFNGTDEEADAVFTLSTPLTIIIVFRSITWTTNDYLFDGATVNTPHTAQFGSSPPLYYRAEWGATGLSPAVTTTYTNWTTLTTVWQGADSYIKLNETAAVTFTSTTGSAGGVTLTANSSPIAK